MTIDNNFRNRLSALLRQFAEELSAKDASIGKGESIAGNENEIARASWGTISTSVTFLPFCKAHGPQYLRTVVTEEAYEVHKINMYKFVLASGVYLILLFDRPSCLDTLRPHIDEFLTKLATVFEERADDVCHCLPGTGNKETPQYLQ